MMTRKVFQELQTSSHDRSVFVGSPKRTSEFLQVIQKSVKVKMPKTVNKENVTVRRSKRKGAIVENVGCEEQLKKATKEQPKKSSKEQPKKSSKEQPKKSLKEQPKRSSKEQPEETLTEQPKKSVKEVTKKPAVKKTKARIKKGNTLSVSEANSAVILNQSRLECFLSPTPSPSSTVTSVESTMLDTANITVSKSISEEISLVSGTPSRAYWQTIAEERQLALEKTLLENELLLDQVTALQTENSLLKSALSAAEKVLVMEDLLN